MPWPKREGVKISFNPTQLLYPSAPKKGGSSKAAIIAVIFGLLTILFGAYILYINNYSEADRVAIDALQDSSTVEIAVDNQMITFKPRDTAIKAGVIFYPGGKVEDRAYAPLAQLLAEEGYMTVIYRMPSNLAVLKPNAAGKVIEKYPEVDRWYLGGHSLGGAMASSYASKNPEKLLGYFALAAYPSSDLSKTSLKMLSIYGSEDGVLNKDSFEKYRTNAPADAKYVEIAGGNHAYFGNYGEQKGDGQATITREEQQRRTVELLSEFMK
jgi:dienelactone hydrolase